MSYAGPAPATIARALGAFNSFNPLEICKRLDHFIDEQPGGERFSKWPRIAQLAGGGTRLASQAHTEKLQSLSSKVAPKKHSLGWPSPGRPGQDSSGRSLGQRNQAAGDCVEEDPDVQEKAAASILTRGQQLEGPQEC